MANNKQFLVVDDELSNLDWLFAYLDSKNVDYDVAINAEKAREKYSTNKYDLYIIDLNIPQQAVKPDKRPLYHSYAGLNIAQEIRTTGVSGKNVLIYSVHLTPELENEITQRLGCRYVMKGRIKELKTLLLSIIEH